MAYEYVPDEPFINRLVKERYEELSAEHRENRDHWEDWLLRSDFLGTDEYINLLIAPAEESDRLVEQAVAQLHESGEILYLRQNGGSQEVTIKIWLGRP